MQVIIIVCVCVCVCVCLCMYMYQYKYNKHTHNHATPNASCSKRLSFLSRYGTKKHMEKTLELPPNASCSKRVSLLSRYGTISPFFLLDSAVSTLPRAERDVLMCLA